MLKFKGRDDAEENIVEDNLVQSLHQLCRTRGPHAGQMKVFGAQFKLSLLCMHNISYWQPVIILIVLNLTFLMQRSAMPSKGTHMNTYVL